MGITSIIGHRIGQKLFPSPQQDAFKGSRVKNHAIKRVNQTGKGNTLEQQYGPNKSILSAQSVKH